MYFLSSGVKGLIWSSRQFCHSNLDWSLSYGLHHFDPFELFPIDHLTEFHSALKVLKDEGAKHFVCRGPTCDWVCIVSNCKHYFSCVLGPTVWLLLQSSLISSRSSVPCWEWMMVSWSMTSPSQANCSNFPLHEMLLSILNRDVYQVMDYSRPCVSQT